MITCLHTAEVHVATFSALLPDATHIVRADFLDRARADGLDAVSGEVTEPLKELSVTGPVLCTCSTLGPLVDVVSAYRRWFALIDLRWNGLLRAVVRSSWRSV
jgi:hypothetical protein